MLPCMSDKSSAGFDVGHAFQPDILRYADGTGQKAEEGEMSGVEMSPRTSVFEHQSKHLQCEPSPLDISPEAAAERGAGEFLRLPCTQARTHDTMTKNEC